MTLIRPVTIALLTSTVLAVPLAGCQSGGDQSREILIGADLELSGPAAATGTAYQRALELKVEQLNSSGTLGGRQIRLRIRDNHSDADESSRNIREFADDPAVRAVIMGGCGKCVMNVAENLNELRLPTVTLAATGAVVNPVANRRYLFKLSPDAADSAAVLAADFSRKNIRTVALLHTDDDYGREGRAVLAAALGKAKISLVRTAQVKANGAEVRSATRTLVGGRPQALVIWTPPQQATQAAGAARAAKFSGQLFFDAGAAGDLFLGGAAENTTMVFTRTMVMDDVIATTPAKAARMQWFRDYTARYGTYYGLSSFAADALALITMAAVQADPDREEADRERLRNVLETSQLEGVSGPIQMTPDNHSGLMPQALTTLVSRGGRWRLAG